MDFSQYSASDRRREHLSLAAVVALAAGVVVTLGLAALGRASFALPASLTAALVAAAWATERLLLRWRPYDRHGRLARWVHPGPPGFSHLCDWLANSRVVGALLEPLPVVSMVSDITDVIYVNYLLPAETLEGFVPHGLKLQRLGPEGRYALFTFLTYHHGHFGFAFLGPLRRLFPSPVQTNWRVHVENPATGHRGIYFITNAINFTAPALGARLLTEAMPMHVLKHASVHAAPDGTLSVRCDPGTGTAPDCEAVLRPTDAPEWSGPWREVFPDFQAFLRYCVPQDRAMSSQPLRGRVSRQEIHLGIEPERCLPMSATIRSRAATAIAGDATPVCFRVPGLRFQFALEAYDPLVGVK